MNNIISFCVDKFDNKDKLYYIEKFSFQTDKIKIGHIYNKLTQSLNVWMEVDKRIRFIVLLEEESSLQLNNIRYRGEIYKGFMRPLNKSEEEIWIKLLYQNGIRPIGISKKECIWYMNYEFMKKDKEIKVKTKCVNCGRDAIFPTEGRRIDGSWTEDIKLAKYINKWICSFKCYTELLTKGE